MAVRFTKDGLYGRWYGTNAEKVALAGMSVGDKFTETDTGEEFEYSGSAWIAESLSVLVTGSEMELYGATIATRPVATAVAVGTTFVTVTSPLVVYMSDGTNWIEVV